MSSFLDFFPKIPYDISNWKPKYGTYEIITDVTFRINFIQDALSNIDTYYQYAILDGETPEILANKVYGDPQSYWIITYANNIYDPQYDWPLDYRSFNNYINKKYGSIANAYAQPHHYEKVVTKKNETYNTITTDIYWINKENTSNTVSTVPFDYYDGMSEYEMNTYDVDGTTVVEEITKREISCYDYEESQNDAKRIIKIIQPSYYYQLTQEFRQLTVGDNISNYRKLGLID